MLSCRLAKFTCESWRTSSTKASYFVCSQIGQKKVHNQVKDIFDDKVIDSVEDSKHTMPELRVLYFDMRYELEKKQS